MLEIHRGAEGRLHFPAIRLEDGRAGVVEELAELGVHHHRDPALLGGGHRGVDERRRQQPLVVVLQQQGVGIGQRLLRLGASPASSSAPSSSRVHLLVDPHHLLAACQHPRLGGRRPPRRGRARMRRSAAGSPSRRGARGRSGRRRPRPTSWQVAPMAATLAATLAAPPRADRCSRTVTTGTGASGESRSVSPIRYRSSIRSPMTTMRLVRHPLDELQDAVAGHRGRGESWGARRIPLVRGMSRPEKRVCGLGKGEGEPPTRPAACPLSLTPMSSASFRVEATRGDARRVGPRACRWPSPTRTGP